MVEWANRFPKLYVPDSTGANIISLENLNRITLTFYFQHTQSFQDPGGQWLRHNNFMMELKDELQRLEITYSQPEQPISCMDTLFDSEKAQKSSNPTRHHQHRASHGGGPVGAAGSDGGAVDSGAAAGAAATLAYTTGAI
jgi:hypothetical protein